MRKILEVGHQTEAEARLCSSLSVSRPAMSIADQLAAVAAPTKPTQVNTKVSFLFSPKEAASIDGETIWSLGQSGLAELAAMDGRFRTYEKNIFSREGLKTHRENESEWPLDLQPHPSAPSHYAENNLCH